MVTEAPTAPEVGDKLLMLGAGVTVKFTPLLATPPAVTTTFPVVAPVGTTAVMLPVFQALIVAEVPLNVTVPCVLPKFDPAITIDEPTAPLFGVRLVMVGVGITVKLTPLLATPPAVTTTFPVVAPVGTVAVMLVPVQVVVVAVVPLKVTVPELPKFEPAITIDEPTAPLFGVRLVILGALPPLVALNVVMS